MAREFLEYDPLTGVSEYVDFEEKDGKWLAHVSFEQDLQPLLDSNAELRNARLNDDVGKKEMWMYARIPAVIQYELLKKGIDIHDQNCTKRLIAEINANYPYLRTSNKKHG